MVVNISERKVNFEPRGDYRQRYKRNYVEMNRIDIALCWHLFIVNLSLDKGRRTWRLTKHHG